MSPVPSSSYQQQRKTLAYHTDILDTIKTFIMTSLLLPQEIPTVFKMCTQ